MDEAQLAELQVLRERVVEVQALQVLLNLLHKCPDEQFWLFEIVTCMSYMGFRL